MALTLVQQQFLHDLVDEYGDGLTKYCIRNLPKNVDRLQLAQDIVQISIFC